MHVREIPKQIFDELATGREVKTHDFHAFARDQPQQRGLDLINYGPTVVTCDMDHNIWLRLSDTAKLTLLDVVLAEEIPVDVESSSPSVFESRKRLGRLSAGTFPQHMSNTIIQRLRVEFSLGDVHLQYPFSELTLRAARVLYAAPIIGEIAQRSMELLSSGLYETSSFERDELDIPPND